MKKSIFQLAISVSHNSSAALMCDGEIIAKRSRQVNQEINKGTMTSYSLLEK
jgi:hypothetical protein